MLTIHDIIAIGVGTGSVAYFVQAVFCRFLRTRFFG